jgi:uncharacterized protein YdeI (YjbR/CyaY-like superfamily)
VTEPTEILYVTDRDKWRAWLRKNHNIRKKIWLIYYRKHTGKPSLPYDDAVEEALCFGWIDSTIKRLDKKKYARKFTPRSAKSGWSELNIKRAKKMIQEKKMTQTGLAKCKAVLKSSEKRLKSKPPEKKIVIPSDLKKALTKNKKALENFENFAPSYKRMYIGWITNAKRKETQEKRIKQVVKWSEENKKPKMM